MTARRPIFLTVALGISLALPTAAWGHDPRVQLHVGTAHDSCYFDLHPELTEGEFREWAAEGGQILRSRQLSAASTLGAGQFDVSIGYAYVFLDDTKGAWNNTMSHPDAEHYLGQELGFPQLQLRVGVTDRIDAEAFGTLNPLSNYGFFGFASKIQLLRQANGMPVSLAVRPNVSALVGPDEVQAYNAGADVSVDRRIGPFAPFAGLALTSTLAVESSPDTDVGNQLVLRPIGFVGVEYRWKAVSAAAEAEVSELFSLGLRVGGRF